MNQLLPALNAQPEQRMTSREIAKLTEKEHRHVMRDIDAMLAALELAPEGYAQVWTHPQNGQQYRCYELPEDLTITLVAGYSAVLRLRIIRRWQELEAAVPTPRALSTMEILELAMTSERERIRLEGELAIAAPKADFVDRYVASTSGNKGFRQVRKLLEVKEPAFREFLKKEGIMYELGGEWVPYGKHLDAGRFVLRAGTADNSGHAYNTAKFTPKGINWVAGEWAKWQLEQALAAQEETTGENDE